MQITSTYTVGEPQADGRCYVKEVHIAADGRVFPREYLWDGVLVPQLVMEERAAIIGAELLAREAARLAVVGTEVPWTKYEFLDRFNSLERCAIRRLARTDDNVLDFIEMLNASGGVYKSKTWAGLLHLAHIEVISFERAEIIAESL